MQLFTDPISLGVLASLLAGGATGLGALPIFIKESFSRRTLDIMMGIAAGVMLAASAFSLLVPAFDYVADWIGVILIVGLGFSLGGIFVHVADKYIPHAHFEKGLEGPSSSMSRVWLLVLAITIHNFPEGLAVGVSFGTGDTLTGISVAVAIGLQNIPEGLAVAAPLVREGYSRKYAAILAFATGLVEPIGGLLGVSIVFIAVVLLPYGLAFAAGAMVFVVGDEIVPESHAGGNARVATWGLMLGFILMMTLDNIFGFFFGG
ncbi:MAG: ZIP family metal transporter [Candidatus Thorarchaeota archaeon SMTZ1-83]|nr:MAG: protein gufA [Candidatus Thorarchaeota archaeon SMTZ1-83]